MVNVCILVRVVPGRGMEALQATKALPGVRKAYSVLGRYDVVVFATPADLKAVGELSGKVNSARGVKSTETLVEA